MHELEHLTEQLRARGVSNFTAPELLRVRRPDKLGPADAVARVEGRTLFRASSAQCERLAAIAEQAQALRDITGPLVVLNGYRPPDYNREVDGSPTSKHMRGEALDLFCQKSPHSLARAAAILWGIGRITGLYVYRAHVHIDLRSGPPMCGGSGLARAFEAALALSGCKPGWSSGMDLKQLRRIRALTLHGKSTLEWFEASAKMLGLWGPRAMPD